MSTIFRAVSIYIPLSNNDKKGITCRDDTPTNNIMKAPNSWNNRDTYRLWIE